MARIRTIKPGFFLNEDLAKLPAITRLLFVGLWTICDREGKFEYRPLRIKATLFPYEEVDLAAHLVVLESTGFLQRYEANGVEIGLIPNFVKHQRPHHKEPPSDLPDPGNEKAPESSVLAPESSVPDQTIQGTMALQSMEHETHSAQPSQPDRGKHGIDPLGREGNGEWRMDNGKGREGNDSTRPEAPMSAPSSKPNGNNDTEELLTRWSALCAKDPRYRPWKSSIHGDELLAAALNAPPIAKEICECIEALETHGLAKGHKGTLTLTRIVESGRTRGQILDGTITTVNGWGDKSVETDDERARRLSPTGKTFREEMEDTARIMRELDEEEARKRDV